MIEKTTQATVMAGLSTVGVGAYINHHKYDKINHQSHIALAGGVASALTSGFLNYQKFKKEELSKATAIEATIKETTQGGIASTATIVSANYYDKKNYLGAITSVALGVTGIVLVEKISSKIKSSRR